MNLISVLLALFLVCVSAKITKTHPEKNATAKKAFEALFSKVDFNAVKKCGEILSYKRMDSGDLYKSCIKGLRTPKIFEDKFLPLNMSDFFQNYENGHDSCKVMSDIIAKVSEELENTSGLDPNAIDQAAVDRIIRENETFGEPFDYSSLENTKKSLTFELDLPKICFLTIVLVLSIAGIMFFWRERMAKKADEESVQQFSKN